jgi:HD-GYP domain-containing protein (c-di-GMP phosphodiesterase class II)
VDCFCDQHEEILAGLDEVVAWDEVIALDPRLGQVLTEEQLDRALEAFGDFADLKSTFLVGHSRGVAFLAEEASRALGFIDAELTTLRRAALVHDIGVIGVTSTVWDAPGRWSLARQERARTHPLSGRTDAGKPPGTSVCRRLRLDAPRAARRDGLSARPAGRGDPYAGADPGCR